jgi:hypothetical protein
MPDATPKIDRRTLRERAGKPRCVYLSDHQWEIAKQLGNGNAAKGIGQALADAALNDDTIDIP